jgi:hypothetical protein
MCTKNLVRIELVMKSRHDCDDDRADLALSFPITMSARSKDEV